MTAIPLQDLSNRRDGPTKAFRVVDESHAADLDDAVDPHVPARYRGTEQDQLDMAVQNRRQELRRGFKLITVLGFNMMVVTSWPAVLGLMFYSYTNGGPAALFYGFIVTQAIYLLVYLSLAEVASMFPGAGGQYLWASSLAPPALQRPVSYLVGWLCTLGYPTFLTSVCYMAATIIQGAIALNDETYAFQPFHGTLLIIAMIAFSFVFNGVGASRLPFIEGVAVIFYIIGFFAFVITVWTLCPTDASRVTVSWRYSNWTSIPVSSLVGLTGPAALGIGYEAVSHMSEELRDASKNLPISILGAYGINSILAGITILTIIAATPTENPEPIVFAATGYEFIEILRYGLQSRVGTTILTSVVIISLATCCLTELAASSRQAWSLARDGGLPFHRWVAKVDHKANLPRNSVILVVAIVVALSLINLGSDVALNAVMSLASAAVINSYIVILGCLAWRRLYGDPLPLRKFDLGRYGLGINIAALILVVPIWFFAFWPPVAEPSAAEFNWAVVIFIAVLIVAGCHWWVGGARHTYKGPVGRMRRDLQRKR